MGFFLSILQLRHPNILRYVDTIEVEERGEYVVYLVTEPASSFEYTMHSMDELDGVDKEKFLMMGLEQIVSAVSFLNNDCNLIHGNVCSLSVMITDTLDWKLYAFDLTTEHAVVNNMSSSPPLLASSWLVAPQYKSGELGRSEWEVIADSPSWAVDAWGLGCLIQESFSGSTLREMEGLKKLDCIPVKLKPYYQKLLSSQPAKRLNPIDLLEARVMKNDLLMTVTFLQNLAMKDSMEKDSFFQRLNSTVSDIPGIIAQKKILPLLASALEFGGAPPSALTTLMNLSKSLSTEDKEKLVVPVIIKLFSSPDRGIRRCLLENMPSFGPELSPQLVEEQIYPKIQPGFTDVNPYIRELTLKSMVILGPKLQARTLNQNLLKFLAKLQVDEEPGIRANTTILLGTLATNFSESTRKKVLLSAMARALKDPFPPAKMAALKSLQSTSNVHDAEDIATKVIPMVSPLCVDSVEEVRRLAMGCLDEFIMILKSQQTKLEPENGASAEGTQSSNIFGWGSTGGTAVASNSTPMFHHARDTSDRVPDIIPGLHVREEEESNPSSGPQQAYAAPSSTGWEEDDDLLEDMMDAAAAEREARARLNTLSVKSNTTSAAPRAKPIRKTIGATKTSSSSSSIGTRKTAMRLGAKKVDQEDDSFDDW